MNKHVATFCLVLVALIWGLTFLPVQKSIQSNPVFLFLFWRFALASALMIIFSFKGMKNFDLKSVKSGFILGTFLFLGFAFQTFGLNYTFSSSVAFITGLNVVIVPFLAYFTLKARLTKFVLLGSVCSVIGLWFLSSGKFGFGIGEILSLICAFMFAAQIVFTSFYSKNSNLYLLVTSQFLTVCILSFFMSFLYDGFILPKVFDQSFIFAVVITGVFATTLAFFLQTAVQRFVSPTKTAIIFTLEPLSAGIAGYFIGLEELNLSQFFGAFLILFGILYSEIGGVLKKRA